MNFLQILLYLIIIAILVQFIRKKKNKRFHQLLEQFPSLTTYPIIGNINSILLGSFEGLLERWENVNKPYDRLLYWLGTMPCLILKKSEDIAIVLNQCQDRDTGALIDKWIGLGILTARYEEWTKSRRMLAPAFSSAMLSKYVPVFNKHARNLVQKFRPNADTGVQIDVLDCILNANLGAVVENSMGVAIENCGKPGEEFCHAMTTALEHGVTRLRFPILFSRHLDALYLKITGKIKSIDHIKFLPTEILKKKLKVHQNFQCQNNGTDENNVDLSKTIIDLVIKNGAKEGGITETRMRDEVLHIIGAGVETSGVSMGFLMLMLAINQDVQQKAYEEIVKLIADDETLTEDHLINHLAYLEQCIRETVRMYNPVMITSRYTHKEIILSDNTIIPAGILVIPALHFASYDPDLYENPEKWDPEHFSEQAIKGRPKTSQIHFGYGSRGCIGAKYAMMSMKTQIVYILRNYHLTTNITEFTKRHLKIDLSVKSKIGYPVKLTSRQKIKKST